MQGARLKLCGIQKTFSATPVSRRAFISCPKCLEKDEAAKPDVTPENPDTKVSGKAKAPKPLSFLPSKTDASFTFAPPPFTPTKTTKTQKDVEEKWKEMEDTLRWDALLTETEKLRQLEYHQMPPSPTKFQFKLT